MALHNNLISLHAVISADDASMRCHDAKGRDERILRNGTSLNCCHFVTALDDRVETFSRAGLPAAVVHRRRCSEGNMTTSLEKAPVTCA